MPEKIIKHHSAGGIVVSSEGKIALLKAETGEWVIPKGHLEKNELPWQAALREVREELNLTQVEIETYLCSEKYTFTFVENGPLNIKQVDYYLIKTNESKISPSAEGHTEVGWFSLEEATQMISFSGLKQLINTYRVYLERGAPVSFQTNSLTIGIPAKSPKHLDEALQDLRREIQLLGKDTKIQVVIVSSEPENEINRLFEKEVGKLESIEAVSVIELDAPTKASYLNKIFLEAKNEIIVLLDDDVRLQEGLIRKVLQRMNNYPGAAIFSVNSHPLPFAGKNLYERFWHQVLSIKFREDVYRKKDPFLVGRFIVMPRQKTFPVFEDIINEDQFLQMFYWPYIEKFHDLNVYFRSVQNILQYAKRVFRLEKGMAQIRELYPGSFLKEYCQQVKRTFDGKKIKKLNLSNKLQFYLYRFVKKILLIVYAFMPKSTIKWLRI